MAFCNFRTAAESFHSARHRVPCAKSRYSSRVAGFFFAVIILGSNSAEARKFYIDPVNGRILNDGSSARPWSTLQEVLADGLIESRQPSSYPYSWGNPLTTKNAGSPVKAGDTLVLRNGYHGQVTIDRYYNQNYITIMPESGHKPLLKTIKVVSSAKWRIQNLTITPEAEKPFAKVSWICDIISNSTNGPCREIELVGCTIFSMENASAWTMEEWGTRSCNAIEVGADKCLVKGNSLKNVNFGIVVSGDSSHIDSNTIENFSGDALRGLGDFCTFSFNTVRNCYDVNSNHDDGFQSWSKGTDGAVGTGVVRGMKLIGNTIIAYTDPNQPFRGTLQGIGCFDGFFEDWVIENNVICTDHTHGITLAGAKNCRIVNNTVCDINNVSPGPPWICIKSHKNGTISTGCVIRNNFTTAVNVPAGQGVIVDHNIILTDADAVFVNYAARDFRLKKGCAAIDAGIAQLAPKTDIAGVPRPQGPAPDAGAHEFLVALNVQPEVFISSPFAGATFTAPAKVNVAAEARDPDGSVSRVEFYTGTSLITTVGTPPYSFIWTDLDAGVYSITAKAFDNTGASTISAPLSFSVNNIPATGVPLPWQNGDIGSVGIAGSATVSDGTHTIKASGDDIWNSADHFHFVYQSLSGDVSITARLISMGNTHSWAKSGIMIRETLASGARNAFLGVTPSNGMVFQRRVTTNSSTASSTVTGGVPRWLRLQRVGNVFTASQSSNGTTWTLVGSATVTTSTSAYVGLAVTSHNDQVLNSAVFENVMVSGGTISKIPPQVSLTSPIGGSQYSAPASIPIRATASDQDGAVTRVEFYNGNSRIGEDLSSPFSMTWSSVQAGSYSLTARAFDNDGLVATSSPVSVKVTPSVSGLTGEYFNSKSFSNAGLTRVDSVVDFDWGNLSPAPGLAIDSFSVRWSGKVEPAYTQTYTFYVLADDGVRLWVNEKLLIDKWFDQSATEYSAAISLTSGQKYAIRMEYYENRGRARACLLWSSGNQPKQVIPRARLYAQ